MKAQEKDKRALVDAWGMLNKNWLFSLSLEFMEFLRSAFSCFHP